MARRTKGRAIDGILLLNKPQGISSNKALQQAKGIYFAQKAGHTGALDPLATGMLPICFGEATKFTQFLLDTDKTYVVRAQLGERTTTSDSDGEIVETRPVNVTLEQLEQEIASFLGNLISTLRCIRRSNIRANRYTNMPVKASKYRENVARLMFIVLR